MKLRTFLILSSIARIPSVISSTIGGEALGLQNYTFAIVVFILTAAISGIGLLIYRKITIHSAGKRKINELAAPDQQPDYQCGVYFLDALPID